MNFRFWFYIAGHETSRLPVLHHIHSPETKLLMGNAFQTNKKHYFPKLNVRLIFFYLLINSRKINKNDFRTQKTLITNIPNKTTSRREVTLTTE